MPILSQFYGIIIKMYFQKSEHNPPHFHVSYGGREAEYDILSNQFIVGKMPPRVAGLVTEWATIHQDELLRIWVTQRFHRITPLS